jgi:hypothetical protein
LCWPRHKFGSPLCNPNSFSTPYKSPNPNPKTGLQCKNTLSVCSASSVLAVRKSCEEFWECRLGEERLGKKGNAQARSVFLSNSRRIEIEYLLLSALSELGVSGFKDLLGCWARCKAREVVFVHPICGHEYFLRGSVAARTYPILPSSPSSFLCGCLYRRTSLVSCGAVAPIVLRCGIDLLYYNHLPHCAPNSPGLFRNSIGSQKNVSSRCQLETSVVFNFLFFSIGFGRGSAAAAAG